MSKLLKEGGLAGHMSHLYEDPYLDLQSDQRRAHKGV